MSSIDLSCYNVHECLAFKESEDMDCTGCDRYLDYEQCATYDHPLWGEQEGPNYEAAIEEDLCDLEEEPPELPWVTGVVALAALVDGCEIQCCNPDCQISSCWFDPGDELPKSKCLTTKCWLILGRPTPFLP